jgi:hypothetical protein
MKLSATSLFGNIVPKENSHMASIPEKGPKAGDILYLPQGVFRVEAKSFSPAGSRLRLASATGKVLSVLSSEIRPYTKFEQKLASFIRFAFNPDFDTYVKESIRSHGLPVDEDMDWSKWFEKHTQSYKAVGGEELRDEAIHNLLVWALVEKDVLGKFDASKLEDVKAKGLPLERQITNYLIARFRYRFDYIENYMRDNGTNPDEISGETQSEEVPGIFEKTEGHYESPVELAHAVEEDAQFGRFRDEFNRWVHSEDSGIKPKAALPIRVLFDLILVADDPKPRFIVEEFTKLTGLSPETMKKSVKRLGEALMDFSEQAPRGLVNLPVVRRLREVAQAKSSSIKQESGMSLKNKLAALRQKHAPKPPVKKVDKWAKLRRIAEEQPEEMGYALGEVSLALADLAVAADYLAENLGVGPEAVEEEEQAMAAGMKMTAAKKAALHKSAVLKAAAKFRRIATNEPGSLAQAIQEVYHTMDSVAEGIENLAQNLGIDLDSNSMDETDEGLGGLGELGLGELGEGFESPEAPNLEEGMELGPGPEDEPTMEPTEGMKESALHEEIDAADWEYLLEERVGILMDSGMPEEEAQDKALIDIERNFGPKPLTAAKKAKLRMMARRMK